MRCSRKSTTSFDRARLTAVMALLVGLLVPGLLGASSTTETEDDALVMQAIADVVRARIGAAATVEVTVAQVRVVDGVFTDLEARPSPGMRLGRPTRFNLYQRPAGPSDSLERVGYAVAQVHVTMPHVRTARPIERGTVLNDDDVVLVDADIGAVPLKPLPTVVEVVGAMVVRDLSAGDLLSRTVIRLPMLVRRGSEVVTHVRVGVVVVTGRATAREAGRLGDLISLVNDESGRRLTGRVVGAGEVEVSQ